MGNPGQTDEYHPVRSYEEIISRLSSPVNENESSFASIGKDISDHVKFVLAAEGSAEGIQHGKERLFYASRGANLPFSSR